MWQIWPVLAILKIFRNLVKFRGDFEGKFGPLAKFDFFFCQFCIFDNFGEFWANLAVLANLCVFDYFDTFGRFSI